MIPKRGPKRLTDICLEKISRSDLSKVDFTGVPPHLIARILKFVRSPQELAKIQDSEKNKNLQVFNSAVEHKWHQLVLSKYWIGKSNPPVLPQNVTWRMFFDDFQRKENEDLQIRREQIRLAHEKKKKNSKILDSKTANMLIRNQSMPRRRSSSASSSSYSNLGKNGQNFLKKLERMYH